MAVICVDIDGVLTNETEGHQYITRTPNEPNIYMMNELWGNGDTIILHTSRPSFEQDMRDTKIWLQIHNVNYDYLVFGKPKADHYIDDKSCSLEELCNESLP